MRGLRYYLIAFRNMPYSTYFSYKNVIYKQVRGAAMGSPVSAVVANLYMEFFEI